MSTTISLFLSWTFPPWPRNAPVLAGGDDLLRIGNGRLVERSQAGARSKTTLAKNKAQYEKEDEYGKRGR